MQLVYFVPGVAGTELNGPAPFELNYWANYTELALGGLIALELQADGVTPSSPCGVALTPGLPLSAYYAAPMLALQQQLGAQYVVIPWGYDWRLDLLSSGRQLAESIQATSSPAQPAVIVAHSAGGLVARVAWSVLVAAGQTDLVQRIITLGTPHQGSYAAVQLYSFGNSTFFALTALAGVASYVLASLPGPGPQCSAASAQELMSVVVTWPAMYELLPLLGSPDQATDPNRPLLYQAGNWQRQQLSQTWLTHASTTWASLMLASASMPPPGAVTTIAGTGLATPDVLQQPAQLGGIYAYGSTLAGDGAVTTQDALLPSSWQYTLNAAHQDLPSAAINAGLVASEVTAVRSPPPPVPAVGDLGGTMVQSLGPPPMIALNVLGGRGLTVMAGGDC